MKYAIAGSNVEYAKEICKRENIAAIFKKAPYGAGYTMITNLTRGQFKDFKEDMLCLRRTEETHSSAPFVGCRTLKNPQKLWRTAKQVRDGRKCFRATEADLETVFGL